MTHLKINSSHLLLLFLFVFTQNMKSQERQMLEGRIVVDSLENVSGVHVINLNAETGTTTNAQGEFIITAKAGDSIFFSSVQFENRKWILRNSALEKFNEIKLIRKLNEMDEIQIDNIRLSGVLSKDIDRVPKSIYEKLGMAFPKPRRSSLELAIQSAGGGGPLVSVLNTLNGKNEQLEKAKKNYETSVLVEKGLNLLGESFFTKQINIPENEIFNFLFFCSDDSEYTALVTKKDPLLLIEFLKTKVDSFKELREID